MSGHRTRDRIMNNLETIYREAYDRAKTAGDNDRMADLDASYQREQLMLEVLLDVRDALHAIGDAKDERSAIDKLKTLKQLTRLR